MIFDVTFNCPSKKIITYTVNNVLKLSILTFLFLTISQVNGLSWKLLLYPNGYNEGQNQFLSVFLSVTGLTQPSIFECRLEMLHKSKDVNKIFPRKFVETFKNGERIGFPKFYPLVYLEPNGFLSQDILELRFQVVDSKHNPY